MKTAGKVLNIILLSFFAFASMILLVIFYNGLDVDLIWHYLLGKDIALNHVISTANDYTFIPGTEWNQQEWLFDLFFYRVVSTFGMYGYWILFLLSLLIVFVISIIRNKNCTNFRLGYFVYAMIPMFMIPLWNPNRPAQFSTILMLVLLLLYDETNKKRTHWKKWLFAFYAANFAIGIFLCNFHCSQFLPIYCVLFLRVILDYAFVFINRSKSNRVLHFISPNEKRENDKLTFSILKAKSIGLIFGLIGAVVSNPKQILKMIKVMFMNSTRYIDEWGGMPLSLVTIVYLVILFIVIVMNLIFNRNKDTIVRSVMILITGLVSIFMVKMTIAFVMLVVFYGYRLFENVVERIKDLKMFERYESQNIGDVGQLIILTSAVIGIIFSLIGVTSTCHTFDEYVEQNEVYSVADNVLDFVKMDDGARPLHDYDIGNYLMWNDIKVLVDTRQQPYAKESGYTESCDDVFHLRYGNPSDEEIEAVINKYDINTFISTPNLSHLNSYFDSKIGEWVLIPLENYSDTVLYVKMDRAPYYKFR